MGQVKRAAVKPKAAAGRTESSAEFNMGVLPQLMGYMLRQAQLLVYQDFHQHVTHVSIRPPQFSIMEIVNCNPGIRPSDVAGALGISRANLVPLVAELEAFGWLNRQGDKSDGRAQALFTTPLGQEELEKLRREILPHEDRLAERLGPVGRDILLKLLAALVRGGATEDPH